MKKTIVVVALFGVLEVTDPAQLFASDRTPRDSGVDQPSVSEIATDAGYREYAEGLAPLVYGREPIAIERLVDLNGACHTASAIHEGTRIDADMVRLKEYCKGYSGANEGASNWSDSFTARMEKSLEAVREERGVQAVGEELSRLLAEGDAYEARATLQHSAKIGVIPDVLGPDFGKQSAQSPVVKEQLDMLAQLEFCRRGGDCGVNDFSTLTACAVIGPCKPGEGLISLFRRKTTPENYEAALKMSRRLAGNG